MNMHILIYIYPYNQIIRFQNFCFLIELTATAAVSRKLMNPSCPLCIIIGSMKFIDN